jgi:cellulose biosynthesis protein BcsQ
MTLGTVNAFIASHFFIVPTKVDRVSSEAVRPFLVQIEALKSDLQLDLEPAGIVGTMTKGLQPNQAEKTILEQVNETAQEVLRRNDRLVVAQNLPSKVQITNESDLGYFLSDATGKRLSELFYDKIFDELWENIMKPPNRSS